MFLLNLRRLDHPFYLSWLYLRCKFSGLLKNLKYNKSNDVNEKWNLLRYFLFCHFKQGALVQQNTKNGVIINRDSLVLQKIKRHLAGNYTCGASSVEGDGKSNEVMLKIMCKF